MASPATFALTISEVRGPLFEGEVVSVTLPGTAGVFTVLPRHEPLIALLRKGVITVRQKDGEQTFDIEKGLFEVNGNKATVLV